MTELPPADEPFSFFELQKATRNHGMPLEALRYDFTPLGLHYLLNHFDIFDGDAATWRLDVAGSVGQALSLSMDDLRARPAQTIPVTMECAGNGRVRMPERVKSQPWIQEGVATAEWTGTPLVALLEEAGIGADAVELVFIGADRGVQGDVEQDYAWSLTLDEAMRREVLLAYAMNGRPLEPQHGAPLRLVVPGWYGMASVKWLRRIEAVNQPFEGYQQTVAYRIQKSEDDPGLPVTRMKVRALMVPPGMADFSSDRRIIEAGPIAIQGRAWCGTAPIARVEIGVDGNWHDAELGPELGSFAWIKWTATWQATQGENVLSCRATDHDGNTQPLEPFWNVRGMTNNYVQTVPVIVR